MLCYFCSEEANLTVYKGAKLCNCCQKCYDESRVKDKEGNLKPNALDLSCVWKKGNDKGEFYEERNHRLNSLGRVSNPVGSKSMARLFNAVEEV